MTTIDIDAPAITDFCRKHHIRKLSLFGSALRGEQRPDSDIDLLVEFQPDHVPGFFTLASMEFELSDQLVGRKIDLRTAGALSHHFRESVLREAMPIYGTD